MIEDNTTLTSSEQPQILLKESIPEPNRMFLYSIALISFTVLALQLALVRIFSVMVWYHFTFMIISLALLGYGASGSFLSLFKNKIIQKQSVSFFSFFSFLAGISVFVSYVFICYYPPDPFSLLSGNSSDKNVSKVVIWAIFIFDYILLLLPFLLSGMAMSGAVSFFPKNINKIYSADLMGAGLGCIAMLIILSILGGERAVLICGIFFIVSSILFEFSFVSDKTIDVYTTKARKTLFIIGLIISILGIFIIPGFTKMPVAPNKALSGVLKNPYQKLLFTKWNAISRVDVFTTADRLLLWKVSRSYEGDVPRGKGLMIDADAFTPIVGDDGNNETKKVLNYTITSLGYQFGKRESALIIGPGGGLDVLTADYNKVKNISGVELNPLIVKIVGDDFKEFNNNLYHRENIDIFSDEGRSFVKRSLKKYDILQIPLVDTWAALASGAYSLSENYIYTIEAIEDYWNHLTDEGILSIIRWRSTPPTGLLRLSANAYYAMLGLGIEDPQNHIFIVSDGNLTNFILKKTPFKTAEINILKDLSKKYQYQIIYSPYIKADVMPYVYVLGYEDKKTPPQNNLYSKEEDTSVSKKQNEPIFAGIKKGEFKTIYINPAFAFSSASLSDKFLFLTQEAKEQGAIPLHFSGFNGYNDFENFFMTEDKAAFFKNYPMNVFPTSDESPFFFQHFKFNLNNPELDIFKRLKVLGLNNILSQAGILAILSLFIIAFVFSFILILLPLIVGEKESLKEKNKWILFFYFSFLGFAYIFIEISQIQRFILFLGQPVYSISIVLFTFLTSSGIGSRVSGIIRTSIINIVLLAVSGVLLFVVLYFFFQTSIFGIFLSMSFTARIIISVLMLFPLGFFMGMLFPAGIRIAEKTKKTSLIPWLWAANGICSVLGSILSSFFAMQMGFSKLLLLAGAIYLIALLFIKRFYIKAFYE